MSDTKTVGTQKITTYYDEYDDPGPTNDAMEHHADRREQNRALRNAATGKIPSTKEVGAYSEQDKAPVYKREPKGSIFQRIAKVAAPGMSGEATALGRKGVSAAIGGAVSRGIVNSGNRIGDIMQHGGNVPVWLQDINGKGRGSRGKKTKLTSVPGGGLPAWVFGGGMPWDRPQQKQDVERIVITRIHADGTRTTTTRHPPEPRSRRPQRPEWIQF